LIQAALGSSGAWGRRRYIYAAKNGRLPGITCSRLQITADRYVQRLLGTRPVLRAELAVRVHRSAAMVCPWSRPLLAGIASRPVSANNGRYPAARCSRAAAMVGRPSAAETVQVTNFVGPMNGLSEVITWTCGEVRMNCRSAVSSFQTDRVQ